MFHTTFRGKVVRNKSQVYQILMHEDCTKQEVIRLLTSPVAPDSVIQMRTFLKKFNITDEDLDEAGI